MIRLNVKAEAPAGQPFDTVNFARQTNAHERSLRSFECFLPQKYPLQTTGLFWSRIILGVVAYHVSLTISSTTSF